MSFIKDLLAVLTSRIAVIFFSLCTSVITARYLGPEGSGIIATLAVYPSLFMTIGSLGIRQSTTFFVGQNKFELKEIYGSVLAIWLFTSIFCVGVCYILIKYFTSTDYSDELIWLAVGAIPFSLYTTYSSGVFLGKQNIKEFNRINWVPPAITLVTTIFLVVYLSQGVFGAMLGPLLGVLILTFFVLAKMTAIASFKPIFNFKIIKGMISLGVIYAVSLLIINLNYKVDIVLLERLSTNEQVGIYSKGGTIVQYLWQVPMLLSTLIFSRSVGAKDAYAFSLKTCRLLRFAFVGILIVGLMLFFLSDLIILFLYGAQFEGSILVLKILMPGVLLLTVFKVLNMDLAGRGKPWLSMKAMVPAVILNIVLNILWIPDHGANGASLASTISYSVAAILFVWIYSKETKISIINIIKFTKEDRQTVFLVFERFKEKLPFA